MDDWSLIQFLLNCPAFTNTVETTDNYITATFSDREDIRFDCFFKEIKETNRDYELTGHQIHFKRPGAITVTHFLTVKPERHKLFSWLGNLRFNLR